MPLHVALLRGINVGGKNIVRMAELRAALEAKGVAGVQTYIQSGNILGRSDLGPAEFGALVADVIRADFGVETWPAVIDLAAIEAITVAGETGGDATHAHAFVFREAQEVLPDAKALSAQLAPSERVIVSARAVILYAPDGLARSKFAAKADKAIGVPVTARNFRTLAKLRKMALGAAK